jgi:GNAT superfamily N-acetyltransferase
VPTMADSNLSIRRATHDDLDAIVEVGAAALGWTPGEPHGDLFRWKHMDNPFGESPIWIAEVDDQIAGFRAMMRWELVDPNGRTIRAVRAVDTATHPDFQRRGIFSSLTMGAVEEMAEDGVDIVFNTPNSQSRPGYLKMGWIDVGRLRVAARPTSIGALVKVARARTAAQKWSEPSTVGIDATEAFALDGVAALVAGKPAGTGMSTPLSVEYLQWRYGFGPLHYRAWVPDGIEGGVAVFRVRRRGEARECTVATVLAPEGSRERGRELLAGLARNVDAAYLLRTGGRHLAGGFFPMPNQGPRLTAREVTTKPDPDITNWHLTLGDVELF